jgi:hypothetical protein
MSFRIVCTTRISSLLHDDLALSSTFLAESELTLAVIYGCGKSQKEEIIRRLEAVDFAYNHPILLPGMMAELGRKRLVDRVDNLLDDFALRASSEEELDLDMNKAKLATFLKLCYESRDLISLLRIEKRLLAKMGVKTSRRGYAMGPKGTDDGFLWITGTPRLRKGLWAGKRINRRLIEISSEYDDKINDCSMIIENMSLTMQTASSNFIQDTPSPL